ncbi:MAG: bifunctional tRNA (5-methylaminomethyl-2-thiouridine)(34)-methyltransferase MnmD/FAD-dependent 5-carboxymethylaminomethyl-2-thiouridine(34) oxidoreductase MnmC, partial [Pseudomonadota bacterium]
MSKIKTPQISFDGKGLTSTEFDDIYFQPENGLAETCHVFLEGNDLSKRFSALPPGGNFVVGELGFGTGLNFLVAVDLFLKAAPQNTHLHYWSVEGYPLSPDHLETALT